MKNTGNYNRLLNVFRRAENKEPISIGFIGGSITQGCSAADDKSCYPALIFQWFRKSFLYTDLSYINAGIGATTSQFGAARCDEDLLSHKPDIVFVEYSVNDNDEAPNNRQELFSETFEGLIRKILKADNNPAVIILHSVRYDDGSNEEEIHSAIGKHYGIPCISMKECIYSRILSGEISKNLITADNLHPSTYGHALVASHIIDYLSSVLRIVELGSAVNTDMLNTGADAITLPKGCLPDPITENCYENATRLNNLNSSPELDGFTADTTPVMEPLNIFCTEVKSSNVRDVFKNGWTSRKEGASITFKVKGSEIGILYRKTPNKPAPTAYAVLDGDSDNKILLDANFKKTWGDKAYLETIAHHVEDKEHTLTITIDSAKDCVSDFYLISVITAGKH